MLQSKKHPALYRYVTNVHTSHCVAPVNLSVFLSNLKFLDIFSKKKSLDIKFHENPPIRNRVILFGQADKTDMTKIIFAFRNIFRKGL